MEKSDDVRELSGFINCLSLFEKKTAQLYATMAGKIDLPLVKSLMLEISLDSQKHSVLLKGVADTMSKANWKAEVCPKKVGEGWDIVEAFSIEIAKKDRISYYDLVELSEKLSVLEGVMGEEYNIFVQMKTLELLGNEIQRIYDINLDSVKDIFLGIIEDEDHHRELLLTIKVLFKQKEQEMLVEDPLVRYRGLLHQKY